MKKFISVLIALVLVLSFSTAAFAELEDMDEVVITKNYTIKGGTAPSEEFKFTVEKVSVSDAAVGVTRDNMPLPTVGTVTLGGAQSSSGDVVVTLPKYTGVGIYTYTITENAGSTAGVTYNAKPLYLKVTVLQQDGLIRVAAVHLEKADGEKSSEIENVYEAGSLSVNKTVTGNLGDLNKYFEVTVTLTGEEGKTYAESYAVSGGSNAENPASIKIGVPATFKLKHGDTINVANIPANVTYTVEEADYTAEGYNKPEYTACEGTIAAETMSAAKIVNSKEGTPDTGISLDSIPYVILLTLAVLGTAVAIAKKHISE